MTKEEYVQKCKNEEDWAPGWDVIEDAFAQVYPNVEPSHYGTDIQERAIFGGHQYLDGYSVYRSPKGYEHIVTFGMTELYANEDSFGGEYSRWGYEMTMKLREDSPEDCLWVMDVLSNIARYTYESENYFEDGECIPGNGTSVHSGTDSLITAFIVVHDTRVQTVESLHGKVEFLQLVGITESELNAIRKDIQNIQVLIEKMKEDNPELVTDMNRKKSYL